MFLSYVCQREMWLSLQMWGSKRRTKLPYTRCALSVCLTVGSVCLTVGFASIEPAQGAQHGKHHMSGGATAGLVVGVVAVCGVGAVLGVLLFKRRGGSAQPGYDLLRVYPASCDVHIHCMCLTAFSASQHLVLESTTL